MAGERVVYRDAHETLVVPSHTTRFLLSDGHGGYLALGAPNASNYDGWYAMDPDGARWKILYDIAPTSPVDGIEIDEHAVTRRANDSWQELRVSDRGVRMRGHGAFLLTFDCKRQWDESDQGRAYEIAHVSVPQEANTQANAMARVSAFTITYEKHDDGRIATDNVMARLYVGVATTLATAMRDSWREVRYAYDDRRGTRSTRWVRDVALLSGTGDLAIAIGKDARDAHRKAVDLLLRAPKEVAHRIPPRVAERGLSARIAWRSLQSLRVHGGFYAGLPWFHDRWSRDELTSIGALIAAGDAPSLALAERIIDSWYRGSRSDGSMPAIHPDKGLRSADAPGWLGRRTLDLLATGHAPSPETLVAWRDAADRLIGALPIREGLVWSERNETWMDTASDDDGRSGARVEIQALAIALVEAHTRLCERTGVPVPDRTRRLREELPANVRSRCMSDGVLVDGIMPDGTPDRVTRPNIFIAWYVWPDLLSNEAWRATFWRAIDRLWLPWGGLATIDPSDPRYRENDMGEDTPAYHRGDSWYFVNAIAAMGLQSVDPHHAALAARRLLLGIERDLLTLGYAGHVSEISSAKQQEGMGCHAQLWSVACYIEALLRR